MKLYQVKCLTCGSPIEADPSAMTQSCSFCKSTFLSVQEKDLAPKIYVNNYFSENIKEIVNTQYIKETFNKNKIEIKEMQQVKKSLESLWTIMSQLEIDESFTNRKFQIKGLETIVKLQKLISKN